MSSLFRQEALAAQQTKALGSIVLVRSFSFAALTSLAVAMALSIIIFLIFGTYTQHSKVMGQLVPNSGLIKIYASQAGVVIEKHVTENQQVHAGDVLFVISSERQIGAIGESQAAISAQISSRQQSLREELSTTHLLQQQEHESLVTKISGLRSQVELLSRQIEGQQSHVDLSTAAVTTYKSLLAKNYVSNEQLQQKQGDLLDQQARLQSLQRERLSQQHELDTEQTELAALASKQSNQSSEIERALSNSEQELTESEAKRRLVITASESGTATAVSAEPGQAVDREKPLVSIIPSGSKLCAELYAPSRAVGFIRAGDRVLLRYQAFPYQKFGHQSGTIAWVSKTALPKSELTDLGGGALGNSEPMYQIRVALDTQSVLAYGQPQALQAGMLLDADVLQEKRHLYEWVLDPLFTLSGRV